MWRLQGVKIGEELAVDDIVISFLLSTLSLPPCVMRCYLSIMVLIMRASDSGVWAAKIN